MEREKEREMKREMKKEREKTQRLTLVSRQDHQRESLYHVLQSTRYQQERERHLVMLHESQILELRHSVQSKRQRYHLA
jgi:hypothetical protein